MTVEMVSVVVFCVALMIFFIDVITEEKLAHEDVNKVGVSQKMFPHIQKKLLSDMELQRRQKG